eukprot:1156048-Pelagomonas_calceolata.AAC.1
MVPWAIMQRDGFTEGQYCLPPAVYIPLHPLFASPCWRAHESGQLLQQGLLAGGAHMLQRSAMHQSATGTHGHCWILLAGAVQQQQLKTQAEILMVGSKQGLHAYKMILSVRAWMHTNRSRSGWAARALVCVAAADTLKELSCLRKMGWAKESTA